jgi:hypothetical protein
MMRAFALLLVACSANRNSVGVDAGSDLNVSLDAAQAGCPQSPPTNGVACDQASDCAYYLNCNSDGGSVLATCNGRGSAWKVQASACGSFACGPSGLHLTCGPDEICEIVQGGAVQAHCKANPCGEHAIDCSCAPCSSGSCSVVRFTEYCTTCQGCP